MYKLNGGSGAIICSKCRIIIKSPAPEIWKQLIKWEDIHYCNKCNPYKKFINKIKEFVDEDL